MRARAANGSGSGRIRYPSPRPENVRDPLDRVVSCHLGGTFDHAAALLNPNTHCNLTSCPLGKLKERFTVPTEMDTGCVRPPGHVEEGDTADGVDSCSPASEFG